MQEFILENWKLIAAVVLSILSAIISTIIIVKKNGGKVSWWDAIKAVILEKVPSYISIVEVEGHGEEKKNAVLNMAIREASEMLGRPLSNEESQLVIGLAGKQIEKVLAAPQKKQIAPEKAPKSKYRVD